MAKNNFSSDIIENSWFKEFPSFSLNGQKVSTMALLRRRVDTKPVLFEPFSLHLNTLKSFIKRAKYKYIKGEISPQNWVDFVEKSLTWSTGNKAAGFTFGIDLPSTEIALDAYPLLGLKELYYEYTIDGGSRGHATFFIPDPVMAESTIIALQTAAITGSQMIQFFAPFLTAAPGGGQWKASGDLIAGEVISVSVREWPFEIEVEFGDVPGFGDTTNDHQQVYAGTAREVLENMAGDMGVKIIWLPLGSGPQQIEKTLYVDLAGRPLRDTLSTYMAMLNLKHRWFRSPGGGIATFLVVWDNNANNDAIETFFSSAPSQESKDYENFLQKISSFVTEYSSSARPLLENAGVYIDGIYNMLIPYNMDPDDAEWLAQRYALSEHGKILRTIERFMVREKYPGYDSSVGFLNELSSALAAINDRVFASHARFNIGMISGIGSYKFRHPKAEAIQQIAQAYPGGITNVKIQQESAQAAASQVGVKANPDGTYSFATPSGEFRARPNDPVYVSYDASDAKGGTRVFPSGATFPGVGNPEGGAAQVYPFEVSFQLLPYYGVWPGLPTYVVGFPPLDGGWEFYKVRYELGAGIQRLTAFLRATRIPLYIE